MIWSSFLISLSYVLYVRHDRLGGSYIFRYMSEETDFFQQYVAISFCPRPASIQSYNLQFQIVRTFRILFIAIVLIFFCCYHHISIVVRFGHPQLYIDLDNQQVILKCTVYLHYLNIIFSFHYS